MIAPRPRIAVVVVALVSLVSVARVAAAQVGSPNTITADPPVARPPTRPCIVPLFEDVAFADFSAKSFAYTPPEACRGPWAKIVFSADFDVSAGRQFDRTANVWIGGANVYFGTTAEPSRTVARAWHVERDLTDYAALFTTAQPGEVDLGNLVNATYDGVIHGTARLELYPAGPHAPRVPDVVLPLADHATGGTVALPSPATTLTRTFTLPRNIERAYLDVVAQSQSADEFWYLCVPDAVAGELQSCGGTGFRETEISIDGQPAGVAPVYPWIFTGGIDPFLWAPIPGVQTLDFTPYRVDLTPFAGLLSDGRAHQIALSVFNADNYFSATATLLVVLDRDAGSVSGAVTRNTLAAPAPAVTQDLATASDGSISGTVRVSARRDFTIAGFVDTSHGRVRTELEQHIDFTNRQRFAVSSSRYEQRLEQRTIVATDTRVHAHGRTRTIARRFAWPLAIDFGYAVAADGSATQTTTVSQRDERQIATSEGGWPLAFDVLANAVRTSDTLAFDGSGAFTGNRDQSSSQSYFSADGAGGCWGKRIDTANGVTTKIEDGAGCR